MLVTLLTLTLAASPPKVIVLPFENRSGDPQLEPLRQGLADLVLTDLVGAPGVTVLERARLTDVLRELKLQQTKAFDPTQAVKIGKLLGATHAIAGSLVTVAPKVRLVVRVIALPKGELITTAQVEGDSADLFALETELTRRLISALQLQFDGPRGQHASLQAVNAWSQGVALREAGELDAAKSKLAEAVRLSPDFGMAEAEYAAVLKRLRDSQQKRGTVLEERSVVLKQRLVALLRDPQDSRRLAARIALTNLALVELSRQANAKAGAAVSWPRDALTPLELEFVEQAAQLIEDLRAHPEVDPELDEETQKLAHLATDLDLAVWDFSPSPASLSTDIGNYLGTGWTPHASEVPMFAVRPAMAQRSAKNVDEAKKWFARAEAELAKTPNRERLALNLANARAEMAVLLGRRGEAVAYWQGFLDAHPDAEEFKTISMKIETVLGLDDESEADARAVKFCDAPTLSHRGAALATRWWRAKGVAGLDALASTLSKCGQKTLGFTLTGNELVRIADCEAFAKLKTRAVEQGVQLGSCGP